MIARMATERIARALRTALITFLNIVLLVVVGLGVLVMMKRARQPSQPVELNSGWPQTPEEGIIHWRQIA